MVAVTHAERVVFPEVGVTKGEVVQYYELLAERILGHVAGRPLTLRRYPKGIAGAGFFQKNVPPHYPASMPRIEIPRNNGVTVHPSLVTPEHVAFVANQGAIELHVPCARSEDLWHPDRLVVDLDPPEGAALLARRAAKLVRAELLRFGLEAAPVATGSKGYHVVAPIEPRADAESIAVAMQSLAAILAHDHPAELTTTFRVAKRGGKVFVDWLRNMPNATVVAPFSLRARPRASVATPIDWDELDVVPPDGFTLRDAGVLHTRRDSLAELATRPADPRAFVERVTSELRERSIEVERFDRFRA
jgi:bifunctional non-homologous end joining protein LigD